MKVWSSSELQSGDTHRRYMRPLGLPVRGGVYRRTRQNRVAKLGYFRYLLVGYFEGLDSERGIAWRVADSLGLRAFLGYALSQSTPDHTTISRTGTVKLIGAG